MPWVLGAFFIVHGLIHLSWLAPKPDDPAYPFTLDTSAILPSAPPEFLRPFGIALCTVVALLFFVAGLGVLGVPALAEYWRIAAVVGAILSVAMIGVFWNVWFVVGALLNVAIVVMVLMGWGSAPA